MSNWNPNSKTMKPVRPQHDHPLAYAIAQQDSSVTFFSLCALQNTIAFCNFLNRISLELPFLILPKSNSVCTRSVCVCTRRKVLAIPFNPPRIAHKVTRDWTTASTVRCQLNIQILSVDKKNQLDVTFCILYFSSNSCSTCFGEPCAHHQELTTAWCYSLVLVCAVAAGRLSSPVGR